MTRTKDFIAQHPANHLGMDRVAFEQALEQSGPYYDGSTDGLPGRKTVGVWYNGLTPVAWHDTNGNLGYMGAYTDS